MIDPTDTKGIIASLIGVVGTYILKDIVKGVWMFMNRNKRPTREEFKDLAKALNNNSDMLMQTRGITEKMGIDVRRIYLFLKVMSGDKWPKYRSQVEEIEKLNRTQGDL